MTALFEPRPDAPKMLIADDDPAIVRLVADRCSKMGFSVATATNGIQALISANRIRPQVLIIDVNMPELDGLSVCKQLRDLIRESIGVVVVTGRRDPGTMERCKGLGAFYACKGPDFWSNLASALTDIFPHMAERIHRETKQSTGAGVPQRPRVLLVDDDPDMRDFFSSRLDKYSVDLSYAPDAVQGFRMACKEEPSAIIADYFMPAGDPFYLLWRLRTTPATAVVPVLILSGRKLDNWTEQNLKREICGHPGAAGIFRKSFDTNELFDALQKYCGFEMSRLQSDLVDEKSNAHI